jgi:hypothetical protein
MKTFVRAVVACAVLLGVRAASAEEASPPVGHMTMTPPAGFTLADTFTGFVNRPQNASIVFNENTGSFDDIRNHLTPQGFAKVGVQILSKKDLEGLPGKAFEIEATETLGSTTFHKWIIVVDGSSFVGMIIFGEPLNSGVFSDATIRSAVASIKLRAESGDRISALPFTYAPSGALKYSTVSSGNAVMLTAEPEGQTSPDGPMFSILLLQELKTPIAAKLYPAMTQAFLESLRAVKVQSIQSEKPAMVAGLPGWEVNATVRSATTGHSLKFQSVMVFSNDKIWQFMAMGTPDRFDPEEPDFRAIMASFRPKS